MRFGPVPVEEAEGALLAHGLRVGELRLRKGLRLGAEHVAALQAAGHATVVVARLDEGDVGEDVAAAELAARAQGPHVRVARARTGRVNLFAEVSGVLELQVDAIHALNAVDESLTLATLPAWQAVQAGELIATVKVIPYAVPRSTLEATLASPGGLVSVAPLRRRRVGLILTELPGVSETLQAKSIAAQRGRLRALGAELTRVDRVPHTPEAVATALGAQLADGLELVTLLGASAVIDRADVLPEAIRRVGGEVDRLGIPVDPGNLLLLGHHGDTPLIGIPGCARSPKPSGFDHVLRRALADRPPTGADLSRLGVGGLLKDIAGRPAPRQASRGPRRLGVIVLAAGASRRMGDANKLLVPLDGEPLLCRTVDILLSSAARPVIVVTGHEHDGVLQALGSRDVLIAHNPDFAEGMSTSIRVGLDALPAGVDGAMIALGDMPFVRGQDIEALIEAFDPDGGAAICVPIHRRKRGHPVVWARRFFPALRALTGDTGGRVVLAANEADLQLVEVDGPGVHVDVDTPEVLERLRRGELTDYR